MCWILTIDTLTYKKVFRMSKITILVFAPKQFLRFWAKNLDFHEISKFVTMSRNFPLWFRILFIFMKIFVRYHIFLSPNFSSLEYKLRDLPSVMKMVQESRGPRVGGPKMTQKLPSTPYRVEHPPPLDPQKIIR